MEILISTRQGYVGVPSGLINRIGTGEAVLYTVLLHQDPTNMTECDFQQPGLTKKDIQMMYGPDEEGYYRVEKEYLKRVLLVSEETLQGLARNLIDCGLLDFRDGVVKLDREVWYIQLDKGLAELNQELGMEELARGEILDFFKPVDYDSEDFRDEEE